MLLKLSRGEELYFKTSSWVRCPGVLVVPQPRRRDLLFAGGP